MPRNKLFESWTFKLSMPKPFDDPNYSGLKDFGLSKYNVSGKLHKASLHAPTMRALLAYAKLVNTSEQGQDTDGLGAIGHQDNKFRIAEYKSANKTDCVVFNPNTGKFVVSQFEDGTDTPKAYSLAAGNASGSALLFCLMPILEQDDEFRDTFLQFRNELNQANPDMDSALSMALVLCDNVYRRIEGAGQLGAAGVKLAIPTTGNISTISHLALDKGSYAPTGTVYGQFTILKMGGAPQQQAIMVSHVDFVGKYQLSARSLTAREDAMVPKLPDWYIIPREVVRVCEHALMTCSANTEITDLVGQFIPDTAGAVSQADASSPLPKISDIIMHPPSVYEELTGIYDDDKTEDDVLQKLIEIAVGRLAQKEEQHGQRIRYVDTPLLEAIRYGYVCELQEPSCIANPGVLVGLNSLLDNCQTITLPTGERVHRHPDTVIIVTTNSDYAGCRDVNQSIISRMDLIYDIEAPDLATRVKRVMNVTGCTDEQETTKMAMVVRDIAERCRQTMITDGSCGMRELKAWVLSTMITKDPYESALSTVISSASADPENRADLITTCLEKQYMR